MKSKSVFLKKIASFILSLSIIAGTLACLSASTVSAVTETPTEDLKPGVLEKVTYDFEGDTSSDFHWWATGSEEGSKAQVKADTDDNKVLSFKAAKSWMHAFANLTYELEANSKYKISYRFKAIGDTKICNSYSASGIFIGKNAPNSKDGSTPRILPRLAVVYGGESGDSTQYPTEWTNATNEIKTGDLVNDENKYLGFNFCMTGGTVDGTYGEIYLDDIVIEKIDPNVGFYDFEEDVNVSWAFYGSGNTEDSVAKDTETVAGKDNNYLKLTKKNNWEWGYIVFPFELENGATYKVSFDYKVKSTFYGVVGLTASSTASYAIGDTSTGAAKPKPDAASLYSLNGGWKNYTDTTWTTATNTITVGASDITDTRKYFAVYYATANGSSYNTMYLDNLKIEKIVKLTFGDEAAAITGKPGSEVNLPTPAAKFGYTFDGWYDVDNNRIGNAGDTIICPDVDTTYHAEWVKNTSCNVDFEDGKFDKLLSTGANTPEVVTDPDGSGNKVLKTNGADGESFYSIVLPVELEKDTYYTVSFRYKAKFAEGKKLIQLDITQGTAESPSYVGSYVSLANSDGVLQKRLMRLLDGGSVDEVGKWNENQVSNTDWKTCTYKICATESGNYAMLNWIFYWGQTKDAYIYFDDISVKKTPTATFDTGEGATTINSITENPGTVIKPGCPTREGYRFIGWYVGGNYAGFNTVVMPNENTEFTAVWKLQSEMGDVNMDGNVNNDDFVTLRKILLGIDGIDYDAAAANCHDDGQELILDIRDLVTLKNALAAKQ